MCWDPRWVSLCMSPLRVESPFPGAFWFFWCFGFQSQTFWRLISLVQFPRMGIPHMGLEPHTPQGYSPYLWDPSCLWVATLECGVLVRLHLYLSYPSQCELFIFCCGRALQLVCRPFLEGIFPYVAAGLLCPWEQASPGSSYDTIYPCLTTNQVKHRINTFLDT